MLLGAGARVAPSGSSPGGENPARLVAYSRPMSTEQAASMVTGVDFVSLPTRDLQRAVAFYGETLGLRRSAYRPDRNFAEFETGTVTLNVLDPERMGIGAFQPNSSSIALHVEDVAAARATLETRGLTFMGDVFDTGVCHMAFFTDPDGNGLMLHHRYAPRVPETP